MRALLTGVLLALVAVLPVRADIEQDRRNCGALSQRVDACTRLIRSGRLDRANMAIIYVNRGVAYSALKQYRRAIADYNFAIRLNPRLADAYAQRGRIHLLLKNNRKALSDYRQALRLKPRRGDLYLNRGIAHARLGNHRLAIRDYNAAIRNNSRGASVYVNRGSAYAAINQYRRAIQDYDQAIRLEPNFALAYGNRALMFLKLSRYRRAIQDYDQAIHLKVRHPAAYNNRGLAYEMLGDTEAAIRNYRAALKLDPSNFYARRALRRLGVLAKVTPRASPKPPPSGNSLTIDADTAGHFYVTAKLNGEGIRLLVDTGATSTVLSRSDARKVGIDPSGLDYKIPVSTANGVIRLAVVNINKVQVGAAVFWNVRVLISPREKGSVIGVSTLRRFKRYTVEGDKLTLQW